MRIRPDSLLFILLLSALGGITPLSIDMGLPAFGAIGDSLHVPAGTAGFTLSFFLAGFAFGPLVFGPLSDRFGRRPVLLGGCGLFALAALGCALAPSLPMLLFWRLLQGIGAGAGATLSLAIVRDHFDGATARVRLSYVSTVQTMAPMIAPTLGALILAAAGWRTIYGFLSLAGFLLVAAILFGFEESHRAIDAKALRPRQIVANYARVLGHPLCLGYTLVAAFNFGCLFTYVASSPLVMIGVFGVSPTVYGWTFASTALGIMAGAFINGRLSKRGVPAGALLTGGLVVSLLATSALVAISHTSFAAVETVLPLLIVNTFCSGLVNPNATQGVLHPMPEIAGVASAVLASARMFIGTLATILVSFLFDGHTAHAMAEIMLSFAALAAAVYFGWVRPLERAGVEIEA